MTVLVISMLSSAGSVVGANSDDLEITDVTVSPGHPAPGEEFQVVTVVENTKRDSELDVVSASVSTADGTQLAESEDFGTVESGDAITVPVTASLDAAGVHELHVEVRAETEYGSTVRVQRKLVVNVEELHPDVSLSTTNAVVDSKMAVNVSVANGMSDDVRSMNLTLTSETISIRNPTVFEPQVGPGQTATFGFTAVASESGTQTVTGHLQYRTADGAKRTVTRTFDVYVEPLRPEVAVEATPSESGKTVSVSVLNLGNAPLEDTVVKVASDQGVVKRAFLDTVQAQSTRTITINTSDVTDTNQLDVTATYVVGREQVDETTTVRFPNRIANVSVTGLDFEQTDGKVHITGSASNIGLQPANSVVVKVADTEGVTPAYPSRKYFVGTIPGSEFVGFDVYAKVDDDVEEIPLRITYTANDERHERLVRVPYDPEENDGGSNVADDTQLLSVAMATILLGIVGMIALAWRNYNDGD